MKNILSIAFTGALLAAPALTHAKNDKKPGSSLEGYRFEFPCKGKMPAKPKKGAGCQSALVKGDPFKTDNFKKVVNFGGETGKTYKVTLRFRGVVEPMMYKNGKMDGDHFYIGGEPNNGTYNIYKIDVASPKSHYFLNRQDRVGHRIFTIDYTKTIEIEGGSEITLSGDGQNGKLISNFAQHVVPEVAPAPKPYHGQFIQIDVVKVEEAK
jgi:hypothetical protein